MSMNMKNTITITEARRDIFNISAKVQKPGNYYTLTENGRPSVVLISAEEFESWQETLNVMKEFPNLKKDIAEAEHNYKTGNYVTLEELLAKEGYVLADKSKRTYDVRNSNSKQSSKRSK